LANAVTSLELQNRKNLRYNYFFNLLDGGLFGIALGVASFATILPLFVSTMTDSAVLIGLIPAIHVMGWQLPQLFTARFVARQKRYKPVVLWMTLHERIPFIGLAVVAWLLPHIGNPAGLALTFLLLTWQGLGGGFAATAWQSMIGKIFPAEMHATFFGAQSSAFNLFAMGGAILGGFILERLPTPLDFTLCFLIAATAMGISFWALSMVREPVSEPPPAAEKPPALSAEMFQILRRDGNFRWFLLVRLLFQFATMGFAFYSVYAVRRHGVGEALLGIMTGTVLMGSQIIANPLMGWLADRWSYQKIILTGAACAILSTLVAWWAPGGGWFFLVYLLAGIASVGVWTITVAMTLRFGAESQRSLYIGMANTFIAPGAILAPFIGGWLADQGGFSLTFLGSAAAGLVTLVVIAFFVKDVQASR
jgi:MFS family permease